MYQKLLLCSIAACTYCSSYAQPKIGSSFPPIALYNAQGNTESIPELGKKVVAIFYTDPDAKDVINPISDTIKQKHYPTTQYLGMGVVNCKDTWMPNSAIKAGVRQKIKNEPQSVILLDPDYTLPKALDLPSCNNACHIIITNRKGHIVGSYNITSQDQCKKEMTSILQTIENAIADK